MIFKSLKGTTLNKFHGFRFQINNLTKKFKKKEVLHDIELELETGVYGLLGENGAGKSTLIRCILGLYGDYSGEISYEGKKICNEKIGICYRRSG